MSRTETHLRATLVYDSTGEQVKPGDLVHHTGDRRAAVVGCWDDVEGYVYIWTVPQQAGNRRHLAPYAASDINLRWVLA